MQFGVFNPLSRAHHEGNNAAEPWLFGPEVEAICRKAIELKYQLFPYIYTYAREAHDTGLPIMRALLLEYPNDRETYKLDGQFLFGKELLVAPVVEKGAVTKDVYLPEGEWINYYNGKTVYRGGQWVTVDAPLDIIPVFVKKGSIIPTMPVMQYIHEKSSFPISLEIFPGAVNKESTFSLYEDDGESRDYEKDIYCKTKFNSITDKEGYSIKIDKREDKGYKPAGQRNFILKLHSLTKPKSVIINSNKVKATKTAVLHTSAESEFSKYLWSWDEQAAVIYVKVPDTGGTTEIKVNN
jgi:alpha-glucosidase